MDWGMSLPVGRAEKRVKSRGLPRNRRLDRPCGIMTVVIRRLLVAVGAGERPAKSSLTSPVFVLPDGPRGVEPSPASPTSAQQKNALGMVWELNLPNVTRMVSLLPQLIPLGTRRVIGRVNRPAGGQQWEMPGPRSPIIGEGG